jgi:hypothetical protein
MMFRGGSGLLLRWRNHGGPIFHAKNLLTERSWRTVRYASRLPQVKEKQDYLGRFYPEFSSSGLKNVVRSTGSKVTIILHNLNKSEAISGLNRDS